MAISINNYLPSILHWNTTRTPESVLEEGRAPTSTTSEKTMIGQALTSVRQALWGRRTEPVTADNAATRVTLSTKSWGIRYPEPGNEMDTALQQLTQGHQQDNQNIQARIARNRHMLHQASVAYAQGDKAGAQRLIIEASTGITREAEVKGYKGYGSHYAWRVSVPLLVQMFPSLLNATLSTAKVLSPVLQENTKAYGGLFSLHLAWPLVAMSTIGGAFLNGWVSLSDLQLVVKPNVATMLLQRTFGELAGDMKELDNEIEGALKSFIAPPDGANRNELPQKNGFMVDVYEKKIETKEKEWLQLHTLTAALVKGLFGQGLVKTAAFIASTSLGPILAFKPLGPWAYPGFQALLAVLYQLGMSKAAPSDDVEKHDGYWDLIMLHGSQATDPAKNVFSNPRPFFHTSWDIRQGQLAKNLQYESKKIAQDIAHKTGITLDEWYELKQLSGKWGSDSAKGHAELQRLKDQGPSDERDKKLAAVSAEHARFKALQGKFNNGVKTLEKSKPGWYADKKAEMDEIDAAVKHVNAGEYDQVTGYKNQKMTYLAMQNTTGQKGSWMDWLLARRPEVRSGFWRNGLGVRVGDPMEYVSANNQYEWVNYHAIFGGTFGPQMANMLGTLIESTIDPESKWKWLGKGIGWALPLSVLAVNMYPALKVSHSYFYERGGQGFSRAKKILLGMQSTQGSGTTAFMVKLRLPLRAQQTKDVEKGEFPRRVGAGNLLSFTYYKKTLENFGHGLFALWQQGNALGAADKYLADAKRRVAELKVKATPASYAGVIDVPPPSSDVAPPPPSSDLAPPPPSSDLAPPPPSSDVAPPPPSSDLAPPPPSSDLAPPPPSSDLAPPPPSSDVAPPPPSSDVAPPPPSSDVAPPPPSSAVLEGSDSDDEFHDFDSDGERNIRSIQNATTVSTPPVSSEKSGRLRFSSFRSKSMPTEEDGTKLHFGSLFRRSTGKDEKAVGSSSSPLFGGRKKASSSRSMPPSDSPDQQPAKLTKKHPSVRAQEEKKKRKQRDTESQFPFGATTTFTEGVEPGKKKSPGIRKLLRKSSSQVKTEAGTPRTEEPRDPGSPDSRTRKMLNLLKRGGGHVPSLPPFFK